jgi:hypothetical protein
MLLARGLQPPRFEVELLSGELLETATWPEISSRSSTTSKPERLTQPRMRRTAISFLHMRAIIHANLELVKYGRGASEAGQLPVSPVPPEFDG